ncbi:hypothetical protein E5288_WYG006428 [Bos mutus]|uniref:Uncharacterized protein n=1 Tax=Bos mutus TaxID=72004 RepID=A0A6B0QY64_9CETA|nr:hypothetical protein [Bos mutus]
MLAFLDKFLIRNHSDFQRESKVFSLEMKGDSCRYLAGEGGGGAGSEIQKDYMLVMLLLQDNLTLWRSNQQDKEAGENNAGTSVLTPPCPASPSSSQSLSI